jgi:acyl-CoA reductase-like NAD-dependent aldehyde dehydrogenase
MTADIAALFACQRANRQKIAEAGPAQRKNKLLKLKQALVARRSLLHRAMAEDFGKRPGQAGAGPVDPVAELAR